MTTLSKELMKWAKAKNVKPALSFDINKAAKPNERQVTQTNKLLELLAGRQNVKK